MKFKTIETTIPTSMKWKAIDKDGSIIVFQRKPHIQKFSGKWDVKAGIWQEIGKGPKPSDWVKTLQKI